MRTLMTASALNERLAASKKINLVAASNLVSPYVSSCMKRIDFPYVAEGYVGRRFHAGGELLDEIETLAVENTKMVFGATKVLVQAWRCTNAIVATCFALAKPGDVILGLSCSSGGYYATGSTSAHFLSRVFQIETYDVDVSSHLLDYDQIEQAIKKCRPQILFTGDTSYSRHWDWKTVADIAKSYGCYMVADVSQYAGLIAANVYPSPFPYADVVVFATYKTLRGPKGAVIAARDSDIYNQVRRALYPGAQGSCCSTTITGIAAAMEFARTQEFVDYAQRVVDSAIYLADGLSEQGFKIISGGTQNHSFVIDIPDTCRKNARQISEELSNLGIRTNATPVPFDRRSLMECSGIRVGTTAIATETMLQDFLDKIVVDIASGLRQSLK